MSDPFLVLSSVFTALAVYGIGFTAGRNYSKREARRGRVVVGAVDVADGTAFIAGKQVEIPAQTVSIEAVYEARR